LSAIFTENYGHNLEKLDAQFGDYTDDDEEEEEDTPENTL